MLALCFFGLAGKMGHDSFTEYTPVLAICSPILSWLDAGLCLLVTPGRLWLDAGFCLVVTPGRFRNAALVQHVGSKDRGRDNIGVEIIKGP